MKYFYCINRISNIIHTYEFDYSMGFISFYIEKENFEVAFSLFQIVFCHKKYIDYQIHMYKTNLNPYNCNIQSILEKHKKMV